MVGLLLQSSVYENQLICLTPMEYGVFNTYIHVPGSIVMSIERYGFYVHTDSIGLVCILQVSWRCTQLLSAHVSRTCSRTYTYVGYLCLREIEPATMPLSVYIDQSVWNWAQLDISPWSRKKGGGEDATSQMCMWVYPRDIYVLSKHVRWWV